MSWYLVLFQKVSLHEPKNGQESHAAALERTVKMPVAIQLCAVLRKLCEELTHVCCFAHWAVSEGL